MSDHENDNVDQVLEEQPHEDQELDQVPEQVDANDNEEEEKALAAQRK